ncbi:exopolysaccharide biosynthesis polyprenyl glycosylphosphotransferase [Methylobacterium nigriterrae]|uniref:exopolysaccharide biosynthesis polyprenyl glycosylphosphotransferase n=1 Tax=Methylobacterium nigriterrae TaxID=3127512 RepID=UPI003D66B526
MSSFVAGNLTHPPRASGRYADGAKRLLDIALSALALVALAPLLILVAGAIRLDTRGPILFRQTRRGLDGRPFRILKLRTMSVMEDGARIEQARAQDPRVTRVGAWLRRTSIDELPQLVNVLRGEMSLVGPRPHAIAHDEYYGALIDEYAIRHRVRPGLTGWAQINGSRGPTPELSDMVDRVRLDAWYVRNRSLRLDLLIILRTARVAAFSEGAL